MSPAKIFTWDIDFFKEDTHVLIITLVSWQGDPICDRKYN